MIKPMASFDWGVFRMLGEKLAPNIHSKTKNQKDTTEICSLSKSEKKLTSNKHIARNWISKLSPKIKCKTSI